MLAEEHLRAGRIDDAIGAAKEEVRGNPADPRLRRFLFQLLCLTGDWEKALTQLSVLGDMDAESLPLTQIFAPVIQCERLRAEVFAGRRSPMVFGEPSEWVGLLFQATHLAAEGKVKAAGELRNKAFEAAPATSGSANGGPFEWIADSDSRLGPLVEVILDGKYFWIPFERIRSIHCEEPHDLRDFVWTAARFVWANEGEAFGFIPTRYPGTESSGDDALRLARKTDWLDQGDDIVFGAGQREWVTDSREIPILELRTLELNSSKS